MFVEKYICVGITVMQQTVNDVSIINNNSNCYNNNFNIGFRLDCIKNYDTCHIKTDHKKFIDKNKAINHIKNLKTQYTDVLSWSIISVYDEIYDKLEQRKYKLYKLRSKLNIR